MQNAKCKNAKMHEAETAKCPFARNFVHYCISAFRIHFARKTRMAGATVRRAQ
jgi:hypothetical protein